MRALLLACLLASPAAALAQGTCLPHDDMAAHLAAGWGEARRSIALDSAAAVVETYANPLTGTWTLVVTQPGGPSCMVASGDAYEEVDDALPPADAPA